MDTHQAYNILAVDVAVFYGVFQRLKDCKVDELQEVISGRFCYQYSTADSPSRPIIGSLFSELQSLKAEFMLNRVADKPCFGLY